MINISLGDIQKMLNINRIFSDVSKVSSRHFCCLRSILRSERFFSDGKRKKE